MKHLLLKSAIVLTSLTALSGCFNSDDDDEMPEVNTSPMAVGADLITQTDTPLTDTLSATDAQNDTLSFSVKTEPMTGTLSVMSNGSFIYTPAANFVGNDSFVFSVTDGLTTPAEATINITIETLQVSFADYSREAFTQMSSDTPLPLNGRAFTQDVTEENAYDDLLPN
ncbi:Ig-like domain-containing protein [Paraglaciecola sp.]|uniref:Ig-like domain-containing protein n=1 Tax=Paraglaciecola sp. TaxID=1920173 RepID=UPI0030F48192